VCFFFNINLEKEIIFIMTLNDIINSLRENKNMLYALGAGAIIILILVVKFALKKGCCPLLNRMTGQVENNCDEGECFPQPVTPHLIPEEHCESGVCPIPQNDRHIIQEPQQITEEPIQQEQQITEEQAQNQEVNVVEDEEKEKVE
jgi:hypothetical protein